MPKYGLIGDSSLYVKNGKKKREIGSQLQQNLGTTDLWYHSIANAGVSKLLEMLERTTLTFDTLGISYYSNEITNGISQEVRSAVRCKYSF